MVEAWIARYGYPAIFLGTFLEGETVLILAGLAAHQGYLAAPAVWLSAFLGTLLGDQLYYALGRRHGSAWLKRRPGWRPHVERARRLLERRGNLALVGFRFVYGIRTVTPFVVGASGLPARRFLPLNVLGAALWAAIVEAVGWSFGRTAETFLGEARRYERGLFAAVAIAGLLAWWLRRRHLRKLADTDPSSRPEAPG